VWDFFHLFPGRCKRLRGKPPLTPRIPLLPVIGRNPGSHRSHKTGSAWGGRCLALVANPAGLALAACHRAAGSTERAAAPALGPGALGPASPGYRVGSSAAMLCRSERELGQSWAGPARTVLGGGGGRCAAARPQPAHAHPRPAHCRSLGAAAGGYEIYPKLSHAVSRINI